MDAIEIYRSYILIGTRKTTDSQLFKIEETSIAVDHTAVTTDEVSGITACPNPFSENITLTLTEAASNFTLYAINGKVVYEMSHISDSQITFGEQLPRGVYVGKITSNNSSKMIKIIKQ